MNPVRLLSATSVLVVTLLSGCGSPHGQPRKGFETLAPSQVLNFATLYSQNCSACHGADGKGGAAIALGDPVYLAIADDATIRKVAANGVGGTSMPAFAQSAGGMLTDQQINVITAGIRSHWGKPGILDGANPPSYLPKSAGNVAQGEATYKTFLRIVPRPGWPRRTEGQFHHG